MFPSGQATPRSEYSQAMAANRLVPTKVPDLTTDTTPYRDLRVVSGVAAGIEQPLRTASREGSCHDPLIAADRVAP